MEEEETSFRVLLQQFISFLNDAEERFCKYFKEHYCNRLGQWASYLRTGTIVNTNMFVETFHRTLKVVYLQHKQNRRIDFLLHTLLKIARDKVFDQLTKLEKGKYSHRITEINKRHKSAVKMSVNIKRTDESGWMVPSERDGSVTYNIKLLCDSCNCKLRCANCDVCIHMYSCTCIDSMLHATVCKHVHLVKMRTTKVSENVSHASTNVEYFSHLLEDKCDDGQLSALRQQVLSKLNTMIVLVTSCHSTDALKTSSKHVTSALMAMKSIQSSSGKQPTLPTKRKYPPNKNSDKQLRFFSTKRRRIGVSQRISKPSQQEVQESRLYLLNQNTTCCAICLQVDDKSTSNFVNWVQCTSCEIWLHVACATGEDLSGEADQPLHDYICEFCSNTLPQQ